MLMHQEEAGAQEASMTRVSTEELTRALTAIESRRQAGLERDMDTIAVGDAIRQLGLAITADELLAEVRAQREVEAEEAARQAVETVTWHRPRKRTSTRSDLARVGTLSAMLLMFLLWQVINFRPNYGYSVLAEPLALLVISAGYTALVALLSGPRARRDVFRQPFTVADAVSFGRDARLSTATVVALARGASPNGLLLDDGGSPAWEMVCYSGEPAVRAWTDSRVSGGRLRVYSAPPRATGRKSLGFHEITLSVSRFADLPDMGPLASAPLRRAGVEVADVPAD